jgi:hypothetical protein
MSSMRTRDKDNEKLSEWEGEEKRDLELENVVGNLLVAEYQVNRLRTRLNDMINGYRPYAKSNKTSTHVFKQKNKWYKLSLRIDESDTIGAKESKTETGKNNQFTG